MNVEKVFDIEGASQEFSQSPQLENKGRNVILKYDFETETGEYNWSGITFINVITYRITSSICEELYMISAYDSVSIVKNSKWIKEIKNVYQGEELFDFNHYVIHFEDYGSYEFIARNVYNGIKESV